MDTVRSELMKQLFENSEAMKRGMFGHTQSFFRDLPIARAPLEVLMAIQHLQPVSSKKVAQQLYLTPGAVSQSVDTLDQHGFLVRTSNPDDRRVQHLKLSKKGEKLLQDIGKRRRQLMESVVESLTTEELATWVKVQTKMYEQFKAVHMKNQTNDTKKESK